MITQHYVSSKHKITEMLNLKKTSKIIESSTAKPIIPQCHSPKLGGQPWVSRFPSGMVQSCSQPEVSVQGLVKAQERELPHLPGPLFRVFAWVQALCALISQPLYLRHIHSLVPDFFWLFIPPTQIYKLEKKIGLTYHLVLIVVPW